MKHLISFAVLLIAWPLCSAADDLEDVFQQLKAAESKKDAALVKKLAGETCALARKLSSSQPPDNEAAKDVWTKRVAYARDVELYTEYALSAVALQSEPATTIDLIATLEEQNPKSKYLGDAYGAYFLALTRTGASSKIIPIAQRAVASQPDNEDVLLVLADNAMNRRQLDTALNYSERIINVMGRHGKPEGMAAADWERKRSVTLGRARWISGMIHSEKGQYFEADKDLRVALPLVRGNDAMLAPTLFYLGIANYQLGASMRDRGKIMEAAKFSEEAAGIKSALSQQAWRNAQAMKAEALKIR